MKRVLGFLLQRPVGVSAVCAAGVAFGIMACLRLPVALLPSLAYPAFVVWTAWPEVPPDQVERGVTLPIEQALAGIQGVRGIQSRSQLGGSMVRLDFAWNAELAATGLEIRRELDRLLGVLPERAKRPLVIRVNPSERPVQVIALGAEDSPVPTARDLLEWKELGLEVVARRLEQLPGVARVRVSGGYSREVRLELESQRMDAYGVDLPTLEKALGEADVSLAGGTVKNGPFRYAVEVSGEFRDLHDVGATTIPRSGMPPIRLSDVARVREDVAPRRGLVRFDGHEVLLLLVERLPEANTVRTAAEVREALRSLRQELPRVRLDIVVDESTFIEEAIDGVVQALAWGGALAILILVAFLRRLHLLMAVAVAVPLSLALALVAFDVLGITLNLLSLSGLALGVGLLVDNSIVVVENISRWREMGFDAKEASASGVAEVSGAILASTLTTLAVFLPLTFVEGLAGRLFRDQSLAVVSSVGASLLVALTVVPLIASRDRTGARRAAPAARSSRGLDAYEWLLRAGLRHPVRVLGIALIFLGLSAWVAFRLPREVVPEADEGRLALRLDLSPDAGLELVDARSEALEAQLLAAPGVAHVLADLGERDDARLDLDPRPPFAADLTVMLAPGTEARDVLPVLPRIPSEPGTSLISRAVRTQLEELLVDGDSDLTLDLSATDRDAAEAVAEEVLAALRSRPELLQVERGDTGTVSAYDLRLDRDTTARFGVATADLDAWIEAAVQGREVARLHRIREDVPIVARVETGSLAHLLRQRVSADVGRLPIEEILRVETAELPVTLRRQGQAPVVRLLADLAPGVGLGAAVAAVESVVAAHVPPEIRTVISGANRTFHESLVALGWSLAFSALLVYLILAAQFESLARPCVVLLVVPFALGGVAASLAVTGQSWNLLSLTGCVVLVGIAVNDAIIKVDFIRQRQEEGMDATAAVLQAGRQRFRPILMTTLTTFLGLLPLALGWGAGGGLRAPLAIAIAGGLWVATLVALIVVPVAAAQLTKSRARVVKTSALLEVPATS